ncbi:MAG: SDR family NAD(P)-dependent oxidoreductase [Porticoccaceae bacterium]|jgi:NAD(P)-dependent dehydrogenase (short-subunit alcohol dehydrogenase family)
MSDVLNKLFSVSGKTALITGGTNGIGLMIARGLVQAGVKTYIVGRNRDKGAEAAAELSRQGQCVFIPGDLSTMAGIDAIVEQLKAQESQLDILINNAGLLTLQALDEVTEEGWDGPVNINLKAPFFMIQKLRPLLRASGTDEDPARVINIGSAGGVENANIEYYSYCASKAGVHHLTRALAKYLAPDHINVVAIAPGVFPSDIGYEPPEEIARAILASIPRKRLGTEEDIVGAVIYLSSRAGAFLTGSLLPVDGGKIYG